MSKPKGLYVRRTWWRPGVRFSGGTETVFTAEDQWAVYRDGVRLPYLVVDAPTGRTVIEEGTGQMVTCWHIGISAGDLARSVIPGQEA